jgi:uncharacterized repeat protein (TIGR03803 family)
MTHRRNLCMLIAIALLATSACVAAAQESVLYSFLNNASDGAVPQGGLVFDTAGNLYGTTASGGNGNHGTVFELSPGAGGTWTETVLYRFGGDTNGDGADPSGTLLIDAEGNLYGTASAGNGVIFELLAPAEKGGAWTEKVLWAFSGEPDGQIPEGSLIFDSHGNLYGVTEDGGATNNGAVFELSPGSGGAWTEQILYSFAGGNTGDRPQAGLVFDTKGNLYGTTVDGGTGDVGLVYELSPPTNGGAWTETVVHDFDSLFDGSTPEANLVIDASGNLYGTASQGYYSSSFVPYDGIAFELSPQSNGTWTESILYAFPNTATDGGSPESNLVFDGQGNLYGTTINGGNADAGFTTGGTVYELMPKTGGGWTEKVLHLFAATPTDGYETTAGVIFDGNGNLYGTTQAGGTGGVGTVFEIASVAAVKPTPAMTVTLSSHSITPAQALAVTVDVAGPNGDPTPTGSVTVTSGSYTSAATALTSGSAIIDIPAGSLATGADTLTASYSGDTNYRATSGTASVTVTGTAVLTSPAPGTTLSGSSATFTWTTGGGVTDYDLWLGLSGPGSSSLYASGLTSATSATVTGLPAKGATVYARLYSIINGVAQYNDYTYTEAAAPAGTPAAMISPTGGSTLGTSNVAFTWSAGIAATNYQLWLGLSGPGSSSLYASGWLTTTSATASSLPAKGATVYARLYSLVNGAVQYNDYTYSEATLAAGTPAAMISPTTGSTLGASNVTFTWTAGTGATDYALWLGTNGPGSSSLYASGLTTATSATVTSLPAKGVTVYARLYSIINGVAQYNDYTYTEQ